MIVESLTSILFAGTRLASKTPNHF